ncbi:hypothetical protein PtA15_3A43 [Puccinia triticina]|uniref:Uncharacterized protein n=1 Tax=Puccinia triticina TaxID=208348 RepID=A0ABY7CD46_9BASI|nr:uncharacterized protein PtA15_3A43 [Puccinia triticina]WAQ82680.1 hypothetical protein PtA15_3A43 [Puccinia triticina]
MHHPEAVPRTCPALFETPVLTQKSSSDLPMADTNRDSTPDDIQTIPNPDSTSTPAHRPPIPPKTRQSARKNNPTATPGKIKGIKCYNRLRAPDRTLLNPRDQCWAQNHLQHDAGLR